MTRLALLNSMPAVWNNLVGRGALSHRPQSRRTSIWLAYLFAIVIFTVDCALPASGALAMLHVLPIAVVLGSRRQESLISIGTLCVLLTIVREVTPPLGQLSDTTFRSVAHGSFKECWSRHGTEGGR